MSRVLAQLLFVLLFLGCATVHAEDLETNYYQELHEQYVRLARSDPAVMERARWDELIGEANAFFARGLSEEYAPKTAFLLARIHEHIYRRHSEPATLAAALEWCQRLFEQYPRDPLADDALLTLGDLERDGRGDVGAARDAYRRILDEYPSSDSVTKAEERLGEKSTLAEAERSKTKKKKRGLLSKLFNEDNAGKRTRDKKGKNEKKSRVAAERLGAAAAEKGDPFAVHPIVSRLPRTPTIVIDPGHGGEEEGAHGSAGILEKETVLHISLALEELLRKRLKAKTVLTRVRDVTVGLAERTQIANQHEADLFISVHANASPSKRLSGIETYYLDNTNDKSSLRLAERENASSQEELSDLGFMLSDLIQNAKLDDSVSLAHYIQNSLVSTVKAQFPDVRDLGVKRAPFFVLVGAHMPCVLVEVSFIDHKVEGARLATREYQLLIAEALFRGVVSYLEHQWIEEERDAKS